MLNFLSSTRRNSHERALREAQVFMHATNNPRLCRLGTTIGSLETVKARYVKSGRPVPAALEQDLVKHRQEFIDCANELRDNSKPDAKHDFMIERKLCLRNATPRLMSVEDALEEFKSESPAVAGNASAARYVLNQWARGEMVHTWYATYTPVKGVTR